MKYYMKYNEFDEVELVGSVSDNATLSSTVTEITEEEYETLLASLPQPEEPEYVDPVDEALRILRGEVVE